MVYSIQTYRDWLAREDAEPGFLKSDQRKRYETKLAELEAQAKSGAERSPIPLDYTGPARRQSKDHDLPVVITAYAGERDGAHYFYAEGSTGIPAGELRLPMLYYVLRYAARGRYVFPLHSPVFSNNGHGAHCTCDDPDCEHIGKHPRTAHGWKDAATDEATLRRWWSNWPDANIGLACGPSGLVLIDLDGQIGIESWDSLCRKHGIEVNTISSRTGGGGRHLFFKAPKGVDIRNNTKKIATGIDVRANGGYIVLPPSIHLSGKSYQWDD